MLQVSRADDLFLVSLQYLGRVCCIWTDRCAAEASLVIIVHLLLRLHMPDVVLGVQVVVALVINHLSGMVEHFRPRVVTLQDHGTARSLLKTDTRMFLLLA